MCAHLQVGGGASGRYVDESSGRYVDESRPPNSAPYGGRRAIVPLLKPHPLRMKEVAMRHPLEGRRTTCQCQSWSECVISLSASRKDPFKEELKTTVCRGALDHLTNMGIGLNILGKKGLNVMGDSI